MQLSIFDQPTGEQLRDAGMQQAVDNADNTAPAWSLRAYEFLQKYLGQLAVGVRFMGEEARAFAYKSGLPSPPSERAWGTILIKAAKNNLIQKDGTAPVSNPLAHKANATVWKKV